MRRTSHGFLLVFFCACDALSFGASGTGPKEKNDDATVIRVNDADVLVDNKLSDSGQHFDSMSMDFGEHPDVVGLDSEEQMDADPEDIGINPDVMVADSGINLDANLVDTGMIDSDTMNLDSGINLDAVISDSGFYPDAVVSDTGIHLDAEPNDTGLTDSGAHQDAVAPDSGIHADADPIDMGFADSGLVDTGIMDSGSLDSGQFDAGNMDAGPMDSGVSVTPAGFVLVPAGVFDIGSPLSDTLLFTDERPQVTVIITRDLYVKQTEVTCDEYVSLMGQLPTNTPPCTNEVATRVTFDNALEYVNSLSRSEGLQECFTGSPGSWTPVGLTCTGYRLPTEAEWEFVAKCGTTTPFPFVPPQTSIDEIAWYTGNSGGVPRPVGAKLPNACGLFDIIGNGHEWTCSPYGPYSQMSLLAEQCSTTAPFTSTRGGSFADGFRNSRTGTRGYANPASSPGASVWALRPFRTAP
jgi:formylglycine-generating enzyme required for sulfatase activity